MTADSWRDGSSTLLAGSLKSEDSCPYSLGKFDEGEPAFVEKVVVSALVDDPDEIVPGWTGVGEDSIDLAENQRGFVPRVLEAQGKSLGWLFHGVSKYFLILRSRLPMPWASYQCNSTRRRLPLGSRTVAIPFSFHHRPRP